MLLDVSSFQLMTSGPKSRTETMDRKILLVAAICGLASAQQAPQATAGPFIDALSSVGLPKIGYAPGVHQAVANTGATPNLMNLIPNFGTGQSGQPTQFLQAPLQAFSGLAQAGTQAFQGFAQTGGQLLNSALAPFQQLAQGRRV
ncbi:uncharacterized protein LOC100905831 [Galendromus occidentalis]|uniref:Uncharacterized protein LOC100905831 n=1 Tax=Galendromus occidentalis TaxID=34638 RepID=A0AAJ6VZ27_9ACAR|nr:uncharacterized protein LOC100905831 [Galendromus occidentalis]